MANHNFVANYPSVRYIIFREDAGWYGVALELNIVEQGSTPQEALLLLFEAVQGYSEATRIAGVSSPMRQEVDLKYEKMWRDAAQGSAKKQPSKYLIFTFGQLSLAPSKKGRFPVPA